MSTVICNFVIPESINYPHVVKKLLNRWSFTCKAFDVCDLTIITDMDISLNDAEINTTFVPSLDIALAMVDGEVVYIEEGGVVLEEFIHPENAVYVFGSDYSRGINTKGVSINSNIALFSEIACGIVLNHRLNR